VGKLDDHKNWRDALEVMGRVNARRESEFWIVGGVTAPQSAQRELVAAARTHGLLGNFHWWPQVEYDRMPHIYRTAAASGGCMLITSIAESFGMCAAEAVACGLPLVSTPVGAVEEMTGGTRFGSIFDHGDLLLAADEVFACLNRPVDERSSDVETCRATLMACEPTAVAADFMASLSSITVGV